MQPDDPTYPPPAPPPPYSSSPHCKGGRAASVCRRGGVWSNGCVWRGAYTRVSGDRLLGRPARRWRGPDPSRERSRAALGLAAREVRVSVKSAVDRTPAENGCAERSPSPKHIILSVLRARPGRSAGPPASPSRAAGRRRRMPGAPHEPSSKGAQPPFALLQPGGHRRPRRGDAGQVRAHPCAAGAKAGRVRGEPGRALARRRRSALAGSRVKLLA